MATPDLLPLTLGLAALGLGVGAVLAAAVLRWRPPWPTDHAPSPKRALIALMALAAAAGAWSGWLHPTLPAALVTAALGWALLLIAWLDAEHLWLPRALTGPLGAGGLLLAAAAGPDALTDRGIGAAVGFAALWLVAVGYRRLRGREGLGGGDPWLLGALGAWTGWQGLPTVTLWACALGLSLALARALIRRDVTWRSQAPFGTYLAFGGWLTWLYGPLGAQPPV